MHFLPDFPFYFYLQSLLLTYDVLTFQAGSPSHTLPCSGHCNTWKSSCCLYILHFLNEITLIYNQNIHRICSVDSILMFICMYVYKHKYCRGTDSILKCLKVDYGLFVCGLPDENPQLLRASVEMSVRIQRTSVQLIVKKAWEV